MEAFNAQCHCLLFVFFVVFVDIFVVVVVFFLVSPDIYVVVVFLGSTGKLWKIKEGVKVLVKLYSKCFIVPNAQ